jgi:hypothetical protein
VLRAARGQHLLPGLPSKLTQLLLLTDLQPGSRAAVECAIELTKLFNARLALMHGEPMQSRPDFWKHDLPNSPDPDPARPALLCLMWEVRQRGLEVGLCTEAGHMPENVWRAAAEREVDLIVLPESLFDPFRPLVTRIGAEETLAGAPCPLMVVEDGTSLQADAERMNFR